MRKVKSISLIALFSGLLFLITTINRHIFHTGQLFFAMAYTLAVMLVNYRGSALAISSLAGLIYSVTSALGPLILVVWIVRGFVVELGAIASRRPLSELNPSTISIIMVASSIATALTHYFLFVKILRVVPELPANVVGVMISLAVVLTLLGSYISAKFLYRKVISMMGGL